MMCSKHRQLLEANATDTDPVETGAGTVGVEQCFVTVGSSFCHRFSWEQYDNTDCTVSVCGTVAGNMLCVFSSINSNLVEKLPNFG